MIVPDTAKSIYWPVNIGNSYDFEALKRYKLHRNSDCGVCIFAPDEIRVDNNEITEDVAKLAIFE